MNEECVLHFLNETNKTMDMEKVRSIKLLSSFQRTKGHVFDLPN